MKNTEKVRRQSDDEVFVDELAPVMNAKEFRVGVQEILEEISNDSYAIICFNVDKFKYINELFGYENGNKVLKGIYQVMVSNIGTGELCAHMNADRFVLLLKYQKKGDLKNKLEKIRKEICQTIEFYGMHYELVFFMGVYECEKNNPMSVAAMIDRAIIAQKSGKENKSISYAFYDDQMRKTQLIKKNMEDRLLPALEEHEFLVYYQPKYNVATSTLAGCEALVRWKIEDGTLVKPNEFIPVFETSRAIIQLDRYVFEQVCKNVCGWLKTGRHVVPVSVNLSRMHLHNCSFIEEYKAIADSYHVPYGLLELELTESAFSKNPEKMLAMVKKLHQVGFALSIDDFGSGYSCLNLLKDIPADVLKLDSKFLRDSILSTRGKKIIESIIRLSQEIGMAVVVEGVETKAQLELLKQMHCDMAQGYYFAKPLPVYVYEELLQPLTVLAEENPASQQSGHC